MIEDAKLARHRNRHVHNASFFSRPLQSESGAKRCHILESSNFHPLKVGGFAAHNPHRDLQFESFTDSLVLFIHWRKPVRQPVSLSCATNGSHNTLAACRTALFQVRQSILNSTFRTCLKLLILLEFCGVKGFAKLGSKRLKY